MPSGHHDRADDAPYAGRWVARLQGRVVAHGGTPEEALRAAQADRHKERPEVSFVGPDYRAEFPPLVDEVSKLAGDEQVFLVGGAVRDALLRRPSHDFDFSVRNNAIGLARRVAAALNADFYVLDQSFGAARVIASGPAGERDVLDFTSYRGADIQADLAARDLTINAMALDLKNGTILDPVGGSSDLRSRSVRMCSRGAMEDDPIRVLRAVRLAAALDFKIDPGTRRAMRDAASSLPKITPERQRDELFKILDSPRPEASLRAMGVLGVFPYLLPELCGLKGIEQAPPHVYDVWDHTLSAIRHLDEILLLLASEPGAEARGGLLAGLLTLKLGRYRAQIAAHFSRRLNPDRSLRGLLFFGALYHDVSKPSSRSVDAEGNIHFIGHERNSAAIAAERSRHFNLSNEEVSRIETIVGNHLRFFFLAREMETNAQLPSRKAIYHFFRDGADASVDLILLGLADLRGTRGHTLTEKSWSAYIDVARILLENYWEKPQETVAPSRLVDGLEVMRAYGLEQGPLVGEVLNAIREAQAAGEVTTRQEALDFGRHWLSERQR